MYSQKFVLSLIWTLFCSAIVLQNETHAYVVPEPTFEILSPRGFRVSISDSPGVQMFAFHGNLNTKIGANEPGEISGEVYRRENNKWTLQKSNVLLRKGDVLHYWIYVQVNNIPYKKQESYTVTGTQRPAEMQESSTATTSTERTDSIIHEDTENRLIFNEEFNIYNKSVWSRDIRIPLGPDYEFCVYHNDNHPGLVTVKNGKLRIQPSILEDVYGENITTYGKLRLANCTSTNPKECSRNAMAFSILPPIISARLRTKDYFSFRYGKIEIRAKFPEGDWLYPELWLEPRYNLYGANYSSGRVFLGLVRGNENLVSAQNLSKVFDSRKLEFGFKVGSPTVYDYFVAKINPRDMRWNKDFHVYTTTWTANGFRFQVDGEEVGRLSPEANGWLHQPNAERALKIAPFDQEFYINIGVGVGGVQMFPDKTISAGYAKPWKNIGAKPMMKFWQSRERWLPSWRQEDGKKTALEVDYIKVLSL